MSPDSRFLEDFSDPSSAYRSMPLWVWNGEMTEGRITEMLEQYAARGMGGVFVHPRPGMVTEYLSERWFELWAFSLKECKRLGMECNIYDENSYPAGFAGGLVPSRLPHTASQYVEAVVHQRAPACYEGRLLGLYRLEARDQAVALPLDTNLNEAIHEGPILTLSLRISSGNPWTAWFPMADVTRPEVAKEFIASTYEAYAGKFGEEFGKTITSIFCDEPLVATSDAYSRSIGLPLSYFFLKEFLRDHNYDLEGKLADLFVDQEGATATRFDYFQTLQRLWSHNFLKPVSEWCAAHNLRLTGHYMEQEWPHPFLSPSCMDGYRWMQMPGVDLLAPQFDFAKPERSGFYVMTFRELNSAANQLGQERRLCETHGVGGYEATFEDFKRVSDWIMVNGINFVSQHLSFETISGARKYDHPQTFSDHSAWWDSYRLHADHVARLSVALSRGRQCNRVLQLHSTTSGWVRHNPARKPLFDMLNPPPPEHLNIQAPEKMDELRASEGGLAQWLVDHQVDFDLGDELLMADFGKVAGDRLQIGLGDYSVVILPEGMENWCETTLALMTQYLQGGGRMLALRNPPELVNGRIDSRPAELAAKFFDQWEHLPSLDVLQSRLDQLVPPLLVTPEGKHLPPLVGHQMRVLENGDAIHFLANHGNVGVSTRVGLAGGSVRALSTLNGGTVEVEYERRGTNLIVPVDLPSAGHLLWLVSKEALPGPALNIKKLMAGAVIELTRFHAIERTQPNVLGLDFCDLTIAGRTRRGLYVTQANRLCWQSHGFDRDVWDRTVQFRHNFLDCEFGSDTGFRADYHFEIAPDAIESLQAAGIELALEHPELYRVSLNGRPVSYESSRRWLDETIAAAWVGDDLRAGSNTISLEARPFHILCEIDRIYQLGDFGLEAMAPGFRIGLPSQLKLGDWTKQGLIQYPGSVRYCTAVTLDCPARSLVIEIPDWEGSVINVKLAGNPVGQIAYPPYQLHVDTPLAAGTHELDIEVVGTPKNLIGPHFFGGTRVGRWTGPNAWDVHPAAPAGGCEYEIVPYGLLGAVRVVANP